MKRLALPLLTSLTLAIGACATPQPPAELVSAREAYATAQGAGAATTAPVELHEAAQALERAEAAWRAGATDVAADLAYVAERKAQLADVQGDIRRLREARERGEERLLTQAERERLRAAERLEEQRQQLAEEQARAARTQAELEAERRARAAEVQAQERMLQEQQAALEAERQAREQAEAKLQETLQRLDEVASIQQEPERIVITLPGEVLFAFGKATLTPRAQVRLDQVVDAALTQGEGAIRIEGHTDSQGSTQFNEQLSQARAEAVKSYLASKGVALDRIEAVGMGELNPVVANDTPENRAINRRVEIIVERD